MPSMFCNGFQCQRVSTLLQFLIDAMRFFDSTGNYTNGRALLTNCYFFSDGIESDRNTLNGTFIKQHQLEWVCRMNNIRSRAEEIVTAELVYE